MQWFRNRFVWAAVILVATAGAVVLVNMAGPEPKPAALQAEPADLQGQLMSRMRTTLEQATPETHNHGGHTAQQVTEEAPAVICGVRVYGHEPAEATVLADVKTVYGFHLCGVAEQKRPWDVAIKLAGPVIVDMSANPPGIQVVEATADVMYIDRLKQMFPPKYADVAQREALSQSEMTDLRRRYDAAAGL